MCILKRPILVLSDFFLAPDLRRLTDNRIIIVQDEFLDKLEDDSPGDDKSLKQGN